MSSFTSDFRKRYGARPASKTFQLASSDLMAAGHSVGTLAGLLVSAATCVHSPRGDQHDGSTPGSKDRQLREQSTHERLREETREGASRKALALSKHRPVLVRWTSKAIRGEARSSRARRQCQRQGDSKSCNSSGSGNTNVNRKGDSRKYEGDSSLTCVRNDLMILASTATLGRHLVVACEAKVPGGTVLLRERPFAWCVRPEFEQDFCAHCLRQVTHAPTPCLACGITAFCSDACAEVASDSWHGNECLDSFGQPLGPALSGMSTEYRVALRALRRAERDEPLDDGGSEIGESSVPIAAVDAAARCHGEASDGNTSRRLGDQITSMSAIGFNDLQEHYDERKPRERDLLGTEAAVAAVLAHGVGDHEGRGHEASYRNACGNLAAQLASTLVKVSTNAFAISTLRSSESTVGHVQTLTHARVAVGLYRKAAMLNHSCVPNALATFDGGEMTIVATRAIQQGESITISYGPLASKVSSSAERRASLRTAYFFLCECAACSPTRAPASIGSSSDVVPAHLASHQKARAACKVTDFACMKVNCGGTLVFGIPASQPPPLRSSQRDEAISGTSSGIESEPQAPTPDSAGSAPRTESTLWCDRCGGLMPSRSIDELLKGDKEDHRRWEVVMAAVARIEESQSECKDLPRSEQRDRPSMALATGITTPGASEGRGAPSKETTPDPSSQNGGMAGATAAALVFELAQWRDSHLSPRSMRRAVVHDMHARLLAIADNFSGAADACSRATSVLALRYAPEDLELGVEYLKLAELCFNAGLSQRCASACEKARQSLEVCLRPGDERLAALRSMQAWCEAHRTQR